MYEISQLVTKCCLVLKTAGKEWAVFPVFCT